MRYGLNDDWYFSVKEYLLDFPFKNCLLVEMTFAFIKYSIYFLTCIKIFLNQKLSNYLTTSINKSSKLCLCCETDVITISLDLIKSINEFNSTKLLTSI